MKIFLDANVLISVLNKEYPLFTYSSRLLTLTDHPRFRIFTSPLCLAIAFYFAEKKSGTGNARKKIELLCSKVGICRVDQKCVSSTTSNKSIHDFEDGLQYYSALNTGCRCIITEDLNDFYFSEIEVMNTRAFLERYVFV